MENGQNLIREIHRFGRVVPRFWLFHGNSRVVPYRGVISKTRREMASYYLRIASQSKKLELIICYDGSPSNFVIGSVIIRFYTAIYVIFYNTL